MLFLQRVDQGYLALLKRHPERESRLCRRRGHVDAVDMIAAAGFEVVEAANADDAIEILESRPDITVVFTVIQMPGSMDGLKLARAVRGRWPPIRIIATSGHVHVGETDLPEGGRFLPKPYSPRQVTGVLRELMSGGEI
jgi:CheY-like chemotaxis protein